MYCDGCCPSTDSLHVLSQRQAGTSVELNMQSNAAEHYKHTNAGMKVLPLVSFICRALNQAMGRCIRHKNDYGAIILLDERYSKVQNQKSLSRWWVQSATAPCMCIYNL